MRSLLGKVLLMIMAVSLTAWAADDEYRAEPGEPGYQGHGSYSGVDMQDYTESGEPGAGTSSFHFTSGSYLGIDTQDITAERVAPLKLKEERGVEVMMVDQDAPAGKAGVKEHDVILDFNGTKVEGVEQLRRLIHEVPPGRTVTLGLSRDGQPVTVEVQLADRAKAMAHAMPKMPAMPQMPSMPEITMPDFDLIIRPVRSGLQVESLTPQLGEFFGVKGGDGVLVRSVDKNSPGESAGLKAGDVIVRVETEKIANRSDWNMAVRSHTGSKVTIGVVRDKREQNFSLTIPERSKDHSSLWTPGEGMQWEDFGIDFDSSDLQQISTAARQAAAQMRVTLKKNGTQAKAAIDQIKPQLDQMRRSLEEMQRSLRKSLQEL
ncbi:MAG TPA: PDZ domain-containing protein [Terriglobales bacterium]|nr:PDZ domain-containing protein [Terriglobales bacterium]